MPVITTAFWIIRVIPREAIAIDTGRTDADNRCTATPITVDPGPGAAPEDPGDATRELTNTRNGRLP